MPRNDDLAQLEVPCPIYDQRVKEKCWSRISTTTPVSLKGSINVSIAS